MSSKKIARIRIQIRSLNKINVLKMDFPKHFTELQKMKNTQSEIKPIKVGKRPGATYCCGCKDFTHKFSP